MPVLVRRSVIVMRRPEQLTTRLEPSTVVFWTPVGGVMSTCSCVAAFTPSSSGWTAFGSNSPPVIFTGWPPITKPLIVQSPSSLTTLSELALMSAEERTWSILICPPPMSMLWMVA